MLHAMLVDACHRSADPLMATVTRVDAAIGKPPRPLRATWGFTGQQAAGWGAPAKLRDESALPSPRSETMPP